MLYVVATPIGNLGDITLRALDILKGIDVVAAEDTRHSGLLLKQFGIKKPFVSYHEHNEAAPTAQLIECLARGENVALITDAGTPGLSDPGMRLIRECISRKLPFTILPGTSSILTALLGSGFATDRFSFRGFLPVKSGRRGRDLQIVVGGKGRRLFLDFLYGFLRQFQICISLFPDRHLCFSLKLQNKLKDFGA